ncbi:hypothetical protein AND_005384 [Anopheles darlingi]|uniref:Uncharacterized protein n=1 Tax=Anopheles darlingi TaxID=43151 RepID=W5JJH5_ANODA|nr:hypothetical protein AND_005384 [Anopheles darlingi]
MPSITHLPASRTTDTLVTELDQVARKLVLMEQDLERSEEKVEMNESKIVELEEELRVVGNNLKSLEVSEEKATQREESYGGQVRVLDQRLKEVHATISSALLLRWQMFRQIRFRILVFG